MKCVVRSILTAGLIAVGVLCFTIGVLASNLPPIVGRPDIEETRELNLPGARLLRLDNANGRVTVHTHPLREIAVRAAISAYTRSAGEYATAVTYVASLIRCNKDGDTLALVTEPEDRPDGIDVRVDYDILVPIGTDLAVMGSNGNVWVSKGCGQVSVQGRNTDIEIVEPQGAVLAQSTNGRIRLLDAPAGATIRTANGNVYAHMTGGPLLAATTNGAIVARALNPGVTECTLSSQNGGITLVMDEGCSAAVEARTDRGSIRSDFPVDSTSGCSKRRHLQGTIGSGHTKVKMDTLNGNIWIAKETKSLWKLPLPGRQP